MSRICYPIQWNTIWSNEQNLFKKHCSFMYENYGVYLDE